MNGETWGVSESKSYKGPSINYVKRRLRGGRGSKNSGFSDDIVYGQPLRELKVCCTT